MRVGMPRGGLLRVGMREEHGVRGRTQYFVNQEVLKLSVSPMGREGSGHLMSGVQELRTAQLHYSQ